MTATASDIILDLLNALHEDADCIADIQPQDSDTSVRRKMEALAARHAEHGESTRAYQRAQRWLKENGY